MDSAALQTKLDEIDAILEAGVSTVTVDDRTLTYDLQQLRITAERYRRQLATGGKSGRMRAVRYNPAWPE